MSPKKTDRRILHTKRFIRQALLELMQTRSVGEISISELCQCADINRKTFYSHYSTPEDVLNEIQDELAQGMLKAIGNGGDESLESLRFIEQNREVFKILISHPQLTVHNEADRIVYERFIAYLRQFEFESEEMLQTVYQYISGGNRQLTERWLKNNCDQPAERLNETMTQMRLACIEAFAKKTAD